jgi:hypothetical protein
VETEILAAEDGRAWAKVDTGVMEDISWREIEPRRVFIAGQNVPCLRSQCRNLICCFQKLFLPFFGQPSQKIDLWFTNIGCAEFGESISDPLAPWCISKDVVFFFVSHDQEHNIQELFDPNLLQLWEATHEIPPSAFATWRSENPECQTQADQKSPSRESGKKHS